MRIILSYTTIVLLLTVLLSLSSCIGDSLLGCPEDSRNIRIRFSYPTLTRDKTGFDPSEAECMDLFVFDDKGRFVKKITDEACKLYEDTYYIETELAPGKYDFVCWGNLNKGYRIDPTEFTRNFTHFDDTRVYITPPDNIVDFTLPPLFFAQSRQTDILPSKGIQTLEMPIRKNTYTLNLSVNGLRDPDHTYKLSIRDNNGSYHFDNTLAPSEELQYIAVSKTDKNGKLTKSITTLKLERERGTMLYIEDTDVNKVLYQQNLIELILKLEEQGIPVDFSVMYEFDIDITLVYNGSSISAIVSVNGWKVINEENILG